MNDFMNIPVGKIYPHPKNPRKELGELDELKASIEERGILQPLVVVSRENYQPNVKNVKAQTYTVICGHRRLAAAKLAGVKEVKCVISNMSERDQITAMLLENIQRSNLTPLEEADGFQMMLDFGDNFTEISKSTGISEATIRRRVKLLELDREKVESSLYKGATLEQYADVLQLDSEESRNKVLEVIGTDNYNFTIRREREIEKNRKESADFLSQIEQRYEYREREELDGLILVKSVSIWNKELPGEDSGAKYYAKPLYSTGYEIYRDRTSADDEKKVREEQQNAAVSAIWQEHNELRETAYENRRAFINSLNEKQLTKKAHIIVREMVDFFLNAPCYGVSIDILDLAHVLGMTDDLDEMEDDEFTSEILQKSSVKSHKAQVAIIYSLYGDSDNYGYVGSKQEYKEHTILDRIYAFLKELGYSMSDTEKELANGTHSFFAEAANIGKTK